MTRVTVNPNRQVVTDAGHHYEGETLDVDQATADQWELFGWTTSDQRPQTETPSTVRGRANVRARIRQELLTDHTRSNRTLADVVGCDHKTVASVRKELESNGEIPQSPEQGED